MATPIRVQLADDHEVVRAGFRYLLEKEEDMQVLAESASGKQACRDFEQCRPDILVMDISLPDISGLDAMRRILAGNPDARILMLSMHGGMVAQRALQEGAKGFVSKQSGAGELLTAIRQIMRGESYADHGAGIELAQRDGGSTRAPSLSRRQLEVCMLLIEGRSVAEVARRLHLSEKTIYTHREHIFRKLGVSTGVELAQMAPRLGIGPAG